MFSLGLVQRITPGHSAVVVIGIRTSIFSPQVSISPFLPLEYFIKSKINSNRESVFWGERGEGGGEGYIVFKYWLIPRKVVSHCF